MELNVCYRAEKETLWEFMSEVEDQLKKRKWKMVKPVLYSSYPLTNVIQLLVFPKEQLIYGNRYEFRWYAIVEGKAKKSEISEGLVPLSPAPSWVIQRG